MGEDRKVSITQDQLDAFYQATGKRPRTPRRMWRVSQRAHRFTDRRRQQARRAARGRTWRG